MCTFEETAPKQVAYVDMRVTPDTHALRGFVRREDISQSELETFIETCGIGPQGRTEYFNGTRDDDWIELHRTAQRVRSRDCLLHEACVLAADMETHFKNVVVTVL